MNISRILNHFRLAFSLSLFLGLSSLPAMADTAIGYTNETVEKGKGFRLSSSKDQRLAVRLSQQKVQELKGQTIKGFRAAFGTKNATNNQVDFFLTTSLEGEKLRSQSYTLSQNYAFVEYVLDEPYRITGDEQQLFFGCCMNVASNLVPFTADFSKDLRDTFFAYGSAGWQDLFGKNYGAPNLQLLLAGDTLSLTDAVLKTFAFSGYVKEHTDMSFDLELQNFGTSTISSFDAVVRIGEDEEKRYPISGVEVAPHATWSFSIEGVSSLEKGLRNVSVSIENVNQTDDSDSADNQVDMDLFFYPENMEKKVLVEMFTGQTCTNCPLGHSSVASAIEQTGIEVVELEHHAGYVEDAFSMKEDWTLTSLYGGTTYAPAWMLNRSVIASNGVPVMECTSASDNVVALKEAAEAKPYVSIALESQFDEATRMVSVDARFLVHEEMPGDDIRYSIWLVQDSIVARQSGSASDYVHRAVSRGAITDSAWGETASFQVGEVTEVQKSFELPEIIVSTYHTKASIDPNIATDPEHMKLVVFVHQYDSKTLSENVVFNCAEVKIGHSYTQGGFENTALETTRNDQGQCAYIYIYTLDGRTVKRVSRQEFDASCLPQGVCVVREGEKVRKILR